MASWVYRRTQVAASSGFKSMKDLITIAEKLWFAINQTTHQYHYVKDDKALCIETMAKILQDADKPDVIFERYVISKEGKMHVETPPPETDSVQCEQGYPRHHCPKCNTLMLPIGGEAYACDNCGYSTCSTDPSNDKLGHQKTADSDP